MVKKDEFFGKFSNDIKKMLTDSLKAITNNQKKISNVDETINKYRKRNIEAEKPSLENKSLKALTSVLNEELFESILKNETIDLLKIVKPILGEVADAANKVLSPDAIEIPQTVVNALMKFDYAFEDPIPIKTPIDGLEFYSIEKWEEFYRDMKISREKDLANLSSTKYQERLIEHAQFDAIMKIELKRHKELSDIREKEVEEMQLRYTDAEFWLEMVTATSESPAEKRIKNSEARLSVNKHADLNRQWIMDRESSAFTNLFNYEAKANDVVAYPKTSTVRPSQSIIPIHGIDNPVELKEVEVEGKDLAPKLKDKLQADADKAQADLMARIQAMNKRLTGFLGGQNTTFESYLSQQLAAIDSNYAEQIIKAGENQETIATLQTKKKEEKGEVVKTEMASIAIAESTELERLKGLESVGMTELYESKKLEITKKYNEERLKVQQIAAQNGNGDAKKQIPLLEAQQKNLDQQSPIKSPRGIVEKLVFDQVKNGFEKMGDSAEDAEAKTIGVFNAISTNAGKVSGWVGSLKSVFGGMDESLDMVMDTVGGIAQGFASGGPVGGALAIVSQGIKLFGAATEAEKRHQEALKKIAEVTKAEEHAYQLAIKLKNLKYEDGDTIFGSDPYGKAINAAKVYKTSVEDANKSLKGDGLLKPKSGIFGLFKPQEKSDFAALENIQIVTGHKKTGLFGMGKGKDLYSGITSKYKDLIKAEGELNIERAKSVLANEKMSDSDKAAFQSMIENAEAVKQAYGEMKNYLTGIFGQLGNEMTNALVDSFKKGEDASEAFYKSASKMVQQLVKDMIYSVTIAPIVAKAQENAMKIMEDTSLSDEQRMDKLMTVVDNMVEGTLAASGHGKLLYDYANQKWEEKTGENFENTDAEEFTQSSSKGGFETMTQDQAGALEGRFTAMQMNLISIDGNVSRIASWNQPIAQTLTIDSLSVPLNVMSGSALRVERMIEENRVVAINSYYELKDINKNTKELYQMNERLSDIEKNTRGFK
ncbi:hypothetical protein [Dysgonomonas sp. ZJ279]|uniref:hypothetical protein n=1 Tax=Dysgonomonas sp. ZJ279 TaxID=2709796 RepID=UPI0013EC9B8B|nr:hypothetical protein [Dysgonomonas sp. ZJ279]